MTKLGVGHFTIISGHFFTNYNYRFHKTEILMVILKGLTCQNLKRIKSYDTNHKFICNWKFTSHKWPTEIQTVILRCLKPSPFTMPINETPINMSKTGQKIVAFNLLFFSVI